MSSTPTPASQRPLRGTGPVLIVILIIIVALLGYFQIVYYPAHAPTVVTLVKSPVDPHNVTVTILPGAQAVGTPRDKTFSPNVITVIIGYNATVLWMNNDTALHSVTANSSDASLDSNFTAFGPASPPYNNINPGQILNFTFTDAGTYGYYCSYHTWMIGTIVVKSNSTAGPSGTTKSSTVNLLPRIGSNQIFLALREEATDLASNLATLIGSGTAPWSVNLSSILLVCSKDIPAALTKTG